MLLFEALREFPDRDGRSARLALSSRIVAVSAGGEDGNCLNINADLAAAALAQSLGAERLVFLSDVEGIRGANGTCITELSVDEAQQLLATGIISGGMIPKITACLKALETVSSIHIVNGSEPHILLKEIYQTSRYGTMIIKKHS